MPFEFCWKLVTLKFVLISLHILEQRMELPKQKTGAFSYRQAVAGLLIFLTF